MNFYLVFAQNGNFAQSYTSTEFDASVSGTTLTVTPKAATSSAVTLTVKEGNGDKTTTISITVKLGITATASTTWDTANYIDFTANGGATGITGYNLSTSATVPTTWIPVVDAVEEHTETKYQYDAAWARVFHQNVHWGESSKYYTDSNEAKSADTADKYSVLGNMTNYKNTNNKYELLLQYPQISTTLYNRWIQNDNPVTLSIADTTDGQQVPGYTSVHTDWTDGLWGGMALSTQNYTLLDGQPGKSWASYGLGAFRNYNNGFPGLPSGTGETLSVANLWSRIDNLTPSSETTLTRRIGDLTSNTTYYVWAKDVNGNTNYTTVTTNRVDTTGPTITASNITYGANLSIQLEDSQSQVVAWQVVTDSAKPSGTWTDITATSSTTVTKSGLTAGTWYVWAKDAAGNVSSKAITVNKATLGAPTLAAKEYGYNGNRQGVGYTTNSNGTIKFRWRNNSSSSWSGWGDYNSNGTSVNVGSWEIQAYFASSNSNYNDSGVSNIVTLTIGAYSINKGSPTYHTTLSSAVGSCTAGYTVTALCNTSENANVTINKNLTINTNGKTLTRTGGTITVSAGTTTVSGNGTLTNTSSKNAILISNSGKFMTSSSPTIRANNNVIAILASSTNGIELKGGYLYSSADICIYEEGNSTGPITLTNTWGFTELANKSVIYNAGKGNILINGSSTIGGGNTLPSGERSDGLLFIMVHTVLVLSFEATLG